MSRKIIHSIFLTFILFSCEEQTPHSLAIKNIDIFDSVHKKVLKNKTIIIDNDIITDIIEGSEKVNALKIIEGKGRLITPGFIDTHIHLTDIYGDFENAPKFIDKDSIISYKRKLANTYLKYGTTTILDMAQPTKWIEETIKWQQNPAADYPNLYISGSGIISDEEREPYICHTEVKNLDEARKKVQEYDEMGLKHLKLYWRLREEEMKVIVEEAKKRKLNIYGHIDNGIVSMQKAMDLGVTNFEHFLTLSSSVINLDEHYDYLKEIYKIKDPETTDEYIAMLVLIFNYIKEKPALDLKLNKLLDRLAKENATLSTTIHLLGSVAGKTYFFTSISPVSESQVLNFPNYTVEQKKILEIAFDDMMQYLRLAHNKGVKIRIGTDCRDGGKALLSELLLLYESEFSIEDIFQIATLNGSQAIKIDKDHGTIEKGKKADLVIFDKNPFEDYRNFLSDKTVIKGGKIFIGE
ncbi:MAG: amidohydrolase family protein [Flavobacteriaceae bacterium]|nr:amidohydrolase family protein [Flavobacteriaceae bacterium]